jgi:hypothetical protein
VRFWPESGCQATAPSSLGRRTRLDAAMAIDPGQPAMPGRAQPGVLAQTKGLLDPLADAPADGIGVTRRTSSQS